MLNIIEFDSMVGEHLDKVTLTPYDRTGSIPLFDGLTSDIVRELSDSTCLFDERWASAASDSRFIMDMDYKLTEHHAQLGAFASSYDRTFEVYSGAALPSAVYSLLTKNTAIAIDIDPRQKEIAERSAEKVGADLEFILDKAENVLAQYDLNERDIIIYCGRRDLFVGHGRQLVNKYGVTLLFTSPLIMDDAFQYVEVVRRHIIDVFVRNNFDVYGNYDVTVGSCNHSPDQFVFLVRRGL